MNKCVSFSLEMMAVHVDHIDWIGAWLGDIYCMCCQLILGGLFGSCMIFVLVCVLALDGQIDRQRGNLCWTLFVSILSDAL